MTNEKKKAPVEMPLMKNVYCDDTVNGVNDYVTWAQSWLSGAVVDNGK